MANINWIGKAGGTTHAYTITIASTWAGADTVSATINESTVTVTVATGENTTNEVAAALAAAINASNATDNLAGNETRNVGGQSYPEFTEVTATVASSVVTVSADAQGIPFTLSATETTAGSGTATAAVSVTCTGPHHADNAANWSGGSLPTQDDVAVFNQGSSDCSYGLTALRVATDEFSLLRTADYTGTIGLPLVNPIGYLEYRQRWLQMYDLGDTHTIKFEAGAEGAVGGRTYLDLQSQTYAELLARDLGTQGRLYAHGGTVSSAYFGNGIHFTDPDDANQTSGMTIDALAQGGSGHVTFGRLTAWASAGTTGLKRSGTATFDCALDQGTPALTLTSKGTVILRGDGDIAGVTVESGTVIWLGDGDMAGTVNIWSDATLDLRGDGRTRAFSGTINAYEGATIHKGGHTFTLTPIGCTLEDLTVEA